jgi:hypothetical protein
MKTLNEVVAAFPDSVRDRFDFTQAVYAGALARIEKVICPDHGEFSQYAAQFRKGRGCPQCGHDERGKNRRMLPEHYFRDVREFHGNKYRYDESSFKTMQSRVRLTCPSHGDFTINAAKHYYAKQGCGLCETERKKERVHHIRALAPAAKIRNTQEHFFDDCRTVHGGRYKYPDETYLGSRKSIRIICAKHGEFTQHAHKHLAGQGCPRCAAYDPKWESELGEYLADAGFSVARKAKVLDGREIDLYIDELKVGIELHGLHWHTEGKLPKYHHRDKWECAQKKGIRLIQVFEDEWADKRPIVLSRIDAITGRSPSVMGRKCEVVRLDSLEARKFLEAHHIDGFANTMLHYGLTHQGDLLGVASFGKRALGRPDQWSEWEHIRYASKNRVVGGFSKILKRFLSDSGAERLISYCDLRYGDGSLYEACGFKLLGITGPDYWWVPSGKVERVSRYRTRKNRLAAHPVLGKFYAPEKSEREICQAAGWLRIFGVGHQRWLFTTNT